MSEKLEKASGFLRSHGLSVAAGAVLLGLLGTGVRWIASNREGPPPRKVMQYTMVNVQPQPQPRAPPPPPPQTPPKVEDEPQTERVQLKSTDIPPPNSPPPPRGGPAAGPLALAAEGTGPGDAFNLVGNPGGRGLLSGGGLGDGSGGTGLGGGSEAARYAWYYTNMADGIAEYLRRHKAFISASTRVEVRVWADPSGRITRLELVRATGDRKLDEAIQSAVGIPTNQPLPPDIPLPTVLRITARRPR